MSEPKRMWITTTDTLCEGLVPAWRGDDGKPALYATQAEAEADANDEEFLAMGNDPDGVLEVVVEDDRIYDPVDGRVFWQRNQPA